jgi:Protein of unknown function (DUF2911)
MRLKRSMTGAMILAATFILLLVSALAQGQMLSPRKSAEMVFHEKKISVDYSAPSVRGRKIFGELVPYDRVWRFGANAATGFKTEADLIIGNVPVPKGSYTLYVLPSEKGWKLIINKQTEQWGTVYNQEQDLARIDMKIEKMPAPVEQMAISLADAGKGGVLKMEWENTRASVNFTEKK